MRGGQTHPGEAPKTIKETVPVGMALLLCTGFPARRGGGPPQDDQASSTGGEASRWFDTLKRVGLSLVGDVA